MKSSILFIVFILSYPIFSNSLDVFKGLRGLSKIIGGHEATQVYPYMVSVQVYNPIVIFGFTIPNYSHICGGSILSTNYILTAGMQII